MDVLTGQALPSSPLHIHPLVSTFVDKQTAWTGDVTLFYCTMSGASKVIQVNLDTLATLVHPFRAFVCSSILQHVGDT